MHNVTQTSNPKQEVTKMRAESTFSLLCVLVVCGLLSVGIGIMPASISQAAVPDSLHYQGKLTRAGGGPVNGTFDLTFSIYPDDLGSPADWTETQLQVEAEHGVFSVLLGSVNPISASLFDGDVKYLGVQVESDPEMTPLKPMVTTSYAFHSQEADQAANADMLDDFHSSDFVQISGDQTINGIKTFGSIPVLPVADPTTDNHATRKLYVDGQDATRISIPSGSAHGDILYYDGSVWTRLPAGSSGQYLKTQGGGSNPVWSEVTAVPADNSVSQVKLKTAMGEVTLGNNDHVVLPGGQYGFYPQIKGSSTATVAFASDNVNMPSNYVTNIGTHNGDATTYARQRYVTSSGKDHWMFFLGDKATRRILASYQAPDHPCYGSGGDENDIPHPFGSYDPDKHEVILIDNEVLPQLKAKVASKRSLLTVINEDYEIDFDSEPVYQPREIIEVDEYGDKEGEFLLKIKTPEWAKLLIGKDEIYLKRRLVKTLPSYVSYKKLKIKSGATPESPFLSQKLRSAISNELIDQ
jgi:hypothetical protein